MDESIMDEGVDPEYNWVRRTCFNSFNIFLTMFHRIVYDNSVAMQPDDPRKLKQSESNFYCSNNL